MIWIEFDECLLVSFWASGCVQVIEDSSCWWNFTVGIFHFTLGLDEHHIWKAPISGTPLEKIRCVDR